MGVSVSGSRGVGYLTALCNSKVEPVVGSDGGAAPTAAAPSRLVTVTSGIKGGVVVDRLSGFLSGDERTQAERSRELSAGI